MDINIQFKKIIFRVWKNITYVLKKEKSQKEYSNGNLLKICEKDFKNFRNRKNNSLIEYLSSLVKEREEKGKKTDEIVEQINALETIDRRNNEGKEKEALSLFRRTFPVCLPYRSPNNFF